jgi:cellulose synthase/poly-beta-1,6-N-acetylglucosamine synthase-like glycosyltransferase
MFVVLRLLVAVAAVPVALLAARLLLFLAASLPPLPAPRRSDGQTRFVVLIPAHDEERHVALSVDSALAQDYPAERREVVVLADNCADATAKVARDHGAAVEERTDAALAGKHHAIRWFLARRAPYAFDALVILDADTRMTPGYLAALDTRLAAGAPAAQGYNGVLNPDDTPLTRLTLITNTMKNRLYYAGKARLGLSVPLMNGLALSAQVLREHGFAAESVAEDFETYLRLAEHGHRVAFAPEARVLSLKATTFDEARGQRLRWSGGQSQVARSLAPRLMRKALRERSAVLLDAALDLAAPGYATLTAACAALLAVACVLPDGALSGPTRAVLGGSLAALALTFVTGLLFAGPTPARAASVLLAPVFILWKTRIAGRGMFGKGPTRWERGAR